MTEPVDKAGILRMGVSIPCGLEFLVMVSVGVELRPYAYHESSIHRVDVIQHLLRIRITCCVEFMASPLVRQPVLPVLDDIVDRDLPSSHFGKSTYKFVLG